MSNVTVLIPTSPIKSHPSTRIIDEAIASVRAYLPDAPIIVMADGVREEQRHYWGSYGVYLNMLEGKYPNTRIIYSEEHKHQARMTRDCLQYVTTPLVFFLEHDFALYREIPFEKFIKIILEGKANLIRVLLDDYLRPEHNHMMLGEEIIDGVPLLKTFQWSQRPHLATLKLYQELMKHFPDDSKTMIEDVLHGQVASDYELMGLDRKLYIYTPEGPKARFKHLDGREADPKFDMFSGTR